MNTLGIQVHEHEGEPRVLDLDLAIRLGYELPRQIRELINRNRSEIEAYGGLSYATTNPGPLGGRPGKEYFLNEGQALLVCTLSRTEKAAEVRRMLIETFMAWRRGTLPPPPDAIRADDPDRVFDLPIDTVRAYLKMITEARILRGKRAALEMWGRSPLPPLPDYPAATAEPDVSGLDAGACLEHLLDLETDGGTVQELLARFYAADNGNDALTKALRRWGVLPEPRGWSGHVAVANRHPMLEKHFAGTQWRGAWSLALVHLPGARRSGKPLYFHPDVAKAAVIPKVLFLGGE